MPGLGVGHLGPADVHGVGPLTDDDVVGLEPLGDVPEGPVVVHRRRVVGSHPGHRVLVGRDLLGDRSAPGSVGLVAPRVVGQLGVELTHDRPPVADEGDLGRDVVADLFGVGVELEDLHVRVEAGLGPEVHDPVEPGTGQQNDVGLLQGVGSSRPDRERMVVWDHALAHRRGQEREVGSIDELADLVLGSGPGHTLADDHQRVFGPLEHLDGPPDRIRFGVGARGRPDGWGGADGRLVDPSVDHVGGHIEIDRPRPSEQRGSNRLLHVVGNTIVGLDPVGVLTPGLGRRDLILLLEGGHAVLVGRRGATDQNHRPQVLLCVGQAGQGVDDTGTGHHQTTLGPAGQVARGLGGVGGRLLIAHADEGDALPLHGHGDRHDREADDAEHVLDALLLEVPGQDPGSGDVAHRVSSPVSGVCGGSGRSRSVAVSRLG